MIPGGSTENGTALYAVFTAEDGSTSTNRIGNITSNISQDVHFVAEIDDTNSFTSVTLVPNGDGEAFKMGGYLLFSQVGIGSVPAGSGWTPSIPPAATISPADGTTGVATGSNITITFNEPVRLTDDTALNNTNVDSLITLKESNASGNNVAFDATVNADGTVITINPTSDFANSQDIYVSISSGVEDMDNNALGTTNATFTSVIGGVPSVSVTPAEGASDINPASSIVFAYDEAVRLLDDTALDDSNVDNLITLKQTNGFGADIAFDATVSDDGDGGTKITVTPASNFSSNQVVYASIGSSVEDSDNNAAAGVSTTFTTGDVGVADDTATTVENTPVTTNVLSNDSFDGTLIVTAVTNGTNGTVEIVDANTGTVKYTPNPGFNGTDSYTYTATSGDMEETATVNVVVNQVLDDPAGPGDEPAGPGNEPAGPGDEPAGPGNEPAGPGDEPAGPVHIPPVSDPTPPVVPGNGDGGFGGGPTGGDTDGSEAILTMGMDSVLRGDTGLGADGTSGSAGGETADSGSEGAINGNGKNAETVSRNVGIQVNTDGQMIFLNDDGGLIIDGLFVKSMNISANTFDVVIGDTAGGAIDAVYTATMTDGSPLPDWISVDPYTGKISGTPPAGTEMVELEVISTDPNGTIKILEIKIEFVQKGGSVSMHNSDLEEMSAEGIYLPFSQQLFKAAEYADYGEKIASALVNA